MPCKSYHLEKLLGAKHNKGNAISILKSSFLLTEIEGDTDLKIKAIILFVAGNHTTDPATLPGSKELVKNLKYGDDEFRILRLQLNRLLTELAKSSVSMAEVKKCEKVSDVVKLVASKTTAAW